MKTNILRLRQSDLILKPKEERRSAGFYGKLPPEVLIPIEIPIHPLVVDSGLIYSKELGDEVFPKVPDMVREDLDAIARKIRVNLKIEISDEGIYDVGKSPKGFKFEDVRIRKAGITVKSTSMNFFKDRMSSCEHMQDLPEEILSEYAEKNGQYFVWRVNNFNWKGISFELFARNYAMAINNEGLNQLNH